MLFIKVFLLIFSSLSLVQAGALPSNLTTSRPPALVWNSYNETTKSYTFHFWLTNSTFINNDVTEACPDVAIQSAFYLSNVKGMFADSKTNRLLIADWLTNTVGEIFLGDFVRTNYRQLLKETKILGYVPSSGQYDLDDLHEQLRRLAFTDDLAVDWITGNIYYPTLNQINVISSDLSFYINIKNVTDRIRAIAVDPVSRQLYYSTSGSVNFGDPISSRPSRVIATDLAGYGDRTLFNSPKINDVISIAVDYDDNMLYFIDVSSSASRLLSTNISDFSTSPRVITQADNTVFEEVVVYERVVYVIGYINQDSYLWIFPPVKAMKTVLLPARPVSMALMVDFLKEYHNPAASSYGSCAASIACRRICLPRTFNNRVCRCKENERSVESACVVVAPPNDIRPILRGGPVGEIHEGRGNTTLIIVLLPIIAVIGLVAIVTYRRYQQQKMVGCDLSNVTQPVFNQTSFDCESKSHKAQTLQENGDVKLSRCGEEPQTSSANKYLQSPSANNDPKTSAVVNASEWVSKSSHEWREPRASRSSYRQVDSRYLQDYRCEDNGRYYREYYRDGRYPRGYYGDPRASRGYYRDGYQRYSREYYEKEHPRKSRSYYRNDDPRVSRVTSEQRAAGPSRVKEMPSSSKQRRAGPSRVNEMPSSSEQRAAGPSRVKKMPSSSEQRRAGPSRVKEMPSSSEQRAAGPSRVNEMPSFSEQRRAGPSRVKEMPSSSKQEAAGPSRFNEIPSSSKQEAAGPSGVNEMPSSSNQEAAGPSRVKEMPSSSEQEAAGPSRVNEMPSSSEQEAAGPSGVKEMPSSSEQEAAGPSRAKEMPSSSERRAAGPSRFNEIPSSCEQEATGPSRVNKIPSSCEQEAADPSRVNEIPSSSQQRAVGPSRAKEMPSSSERRAAGPSRFNEIPSSSEQEAAGPSRVKEMPSSRKTQGETQPTQNENQLKLTENSAKFEENPSRSMEGAQKLYDVSDQVHANNEQETAEVKVYDLLPTLHNEVS